MKQFLFCVLVALFLVSCGSIKNYNEQVTKLHNVEDLHDDIDKLYFQFKKHHPKLYQYISKQELDFKFDSLKTIIINPITSREFYKKLAPVVANIRQGHVALSSVSKRYTKKERKVLKKQKFEFYDLDFEFLHDKLWVVNTRGKDSSFVGSEVLKFENESALELVNTFKKRFTSDGFNTTLRNRYVGKRFASFYYREKGFLDSLSITFKSKDSLFTKVFKRISKKEKKDLVASDTTTIKKIKPKKLSSEEKQKSRIAKRKRKKDNRQYGYIPKIKKYTRHFDFIGKDSTIAYMKLRSFTNGNYKRFYKESFTKIDSAKTKFMVLDLRDNGGGRIAEIDHLYSYFTDKDYQFITESEVNSRVPFLKSFMVNTTPNSLKVAGAVLSPIMATHNLLKTRKKNDKIYYKFNKHSKIKEPHPLHYQGKLYVLINGNSFSASSLISTHLKATNRATFIGEETGGAYNGCVAGIYKIYELPNTKLKTRMGLMQIEAPYKQNPDGYGVKPDIEITPTIEDRNQNYDTELEWVLNDIEKK